MENEHVYKILSAADWVLASKEGVSSTALDTGDGYVHLSTRAQVGETLALHYKGAEDVRLLEYAKLDLEDMGDLRWEASRGGHLFPHLYGELQIAKAERAWVLKQDSNKVPALPEDV